MIHLDTIAMGDILISRMQDRQMLLAEVSNNSYAIYIYTAVYWTFKRALLKSIHIRWEMNILYGMMNLTQC